MATSTTQLTAQDQEVNSKMSVSLIRNLMRLNLSQVCSLPPCGLASITAPRGSEAAASALAMHAGPSHSLASAADPLTGLP